MAGSTEKKIFEMGKGGALYQLTVEFNQLVTDFRALLTKLDADAGVTDANYSSLLNNADKVADETGTLPS